MDNEKTLLTKDLESLEAEGNAEKLESFASDTELMGGHPELVERAQKFVAELKAKVSQVGIPTEDEKKQIASLKGIQGVSTSYEIVGVDTKQAEAVATVTEATAIIEAKIADTTPELVSTEKPEYIGKHFGPDTEKIQYEITGEAKITAALDGTGKNVLTFPCKVYEKLFQNQEPQMVEQQGFYDPRTKEAYWKSDVKGLVYFTCPDEIKASLEKTYAELNTGAAIEAKVADANPEAVLEGNKQESVSEEIRRNFDAINARLVSLGEKEKFDTLSGEDKKELEGLKIRKNEALAQFLDTLSSQEMQNIPVVEAVRSDEVKRSIAINKLLNLNIPVMGKDFSIYEIDGKNFATIASDPLRYAPDSETSIMSTNERKKLAESQVNIYQKVSDANENLNKLTKEQKTELFKETAMEREMLAGDHPEGRDNPILSLYKPFAQESKKSIVIVQPEENLYPESLKQTGKYASEMRDYMAKNSKIALNILLLANKAKEKGWL